MNSPEMATANEQIYDEQHALSSLQDALTQFTFPAVGKAYQTSAPLIRSEAGKQELETCRVEISQVVREYLGQKKEELRGILADFDFASAAAHRGALLVGDLYQEYQQIQEWSRDFSPIIASFRSKGAKLIRLLEPFVANWRDQIRLEFNDLIEQIQTSAQALDPLSGERDQDSALQLAIVLQETFKASTDIEAVSSWRLGSQIRKKYRRTALDIAKGFDINLELPAVPMDKHADIRGGNRIPPVW